MRNDKLLRILYEAIFKQKTETKFLVLEPTLDIKEIKRFNSDNIDLNDVKTLTKLNPNLLTSTNHKNHTYNKSVYGMIKKGVLMITRRNLLNNSMNDKILNHNKL